MGIDERLAEQEQVHSAKCFGRSSFDGIIQDFPDGAESVVVFAQASRLRVVVRRRTQTGVCADKSRCAGVKCLVAANATWDIFQEVAIGPSQMVPQIV